MKEIKNAQDLNLAAEELLQLVEKHEKGEISEQELLKEWKRFTQAGNTYIETLKKESIKNLN